MTSLVTTAPGKAMLAGEYAVLFGKRALVSAIDRQAHCSFTPASSRNFIARMGTKDLLQDDHPLFLSAIEACAEAKITAFDGAYIVDTSAFFDQASGEKFGLGSSAAAMASLCKLILLQNNIDDKELLFKIAFNAHQKLNGGFGSGADIAASVFEGTLSYRAGFATLENPLPWLSSALFVFTKRSQNTKDFVERIVHFSLKHKDIIERFSESSDIFVEKLLTTSDEQQIIDTIDALFYLLKNLGEACSLPIVSKEIEEIHRLARTFHGSAKPSGAGGGDICMAFVPPNNRLLFMAMLSHLGYQTLSLERAKSKEMGP